MPPIRFVVDRREAGKTLAAVLKVRLGLSWSQAKRLVERRHVRVCGQVETDVARRLKPGKPVELDSGIISSSPPDGYGGKSGGPRPGQVREAPPARSPHPVQTRKRPSAGSPHPVQTRKRPSAGSPRPAHDALTRPTPRGPDAGWVPRIVYSDDVVVVVDKPAGLTTMRNKEEAAEFGERAAKYLPPTLADLLPRVLGTPGRPLIPVHRIDRDTSGLVVFARTRAAAEHLTEQFRRHTVDRRYLALTRGIPTASRIESVLVRDRGDGRRGSTTSPGHPGGQRAVTRVRVVEPLGRYALVECRLETGRTHQVRIHLGEAGTPLCGERVYDRPLNGKPVPDESGACRPLLHAARLGFIHPESGEKMTWESSPPDDFRDLLDRLRRDSHLTQGTRDGEDD
jgi:23S rRNA pseudouridine1911/1915/1917 synthase